MSSSISGNPVETWGIGSEKSTDGEIQLSNVPPLEMSSAITLQNISPRERENTGDISQRSQKSLGRDGSARSSVARAPISKTPSSIPLPVKTPRSLSQKSNVPNVVRTASKLARASSATIKSLGQITNKHTLEIQFINKKKRLNSLKKELAEKQKPVLDLYQNLTQIKKRLEELGKTVFLEEVKLMACGENFENLPESQGDAGQTIPPDVVTGMQRSIEEIPQTLMEICKNLLGRRNVIVELLDSIVKSEVDVADLRDQIETLKIEGSQLQSNLDVVINEHHDKIREIISNWNSLLNDKRDLSSNAKVEEIEEKLRKQEKLAEESKIIIQELQRKLEDKRSGHDRYVNELNNVIHGLKEQMQKLEQDLENEKKNTADFKNRNNANAQNSKLLRNKITELENDKKGSEALTNELNKKLRLLQDQMKHKEAQWTKEKEELTKSLKHQENLLQKLSADKQSFETRLVLVQDERTSLEDNLQSKINELTCQLEETATSLSEVTKEKNDAIEKCHEMEDHIAKVGLVNRETMNMVSNSIDWGKDVPGTLNEAQMYSQNMMKDIMLREYEDKIRHLEHENFELRTSVAIAENDKNTSPTDTEKAVLMQHDLVTKYKQLLAESEQKLIEKSHEVSKLTAEIRQLRVRQEHLEELNLKCPTENLQRMVEEGRNKLNEIMKKSMESEQKILHCESIIEKQSKQMNEMENLLRYRENMAGVLKASRDELILEKESLTRYSHEMRTVLAEVTKEGKMKDRLIKELQDKIELRERQMSKLDKEVRELEANLMMTNEKRFKLQETIGSMEKELQSTKAHVNQLADINTRYEIGMTCQQCYSNSDRSESLSYLLNSDCNTCSSQPTTIYVPNNDMYAKSNESLVHNHSSINNYKFNSNYEVGDGKKDHRYKNLKCKSLIGLSLKQVNYLKTRLKYLTDVNFGSDKINPNHENRNTKSDIFLKGHVESNGHLNKIVQLTAKRYELLQHQAYESYQELTNLVKLALSSQRISEK